MSHEVVHCFDIVAKKVHEMLLKIGCVPGAGDVGRRAGAAESRPVRPWRARIVNARYLRKFPHRKH